MSMQLPLVLRSFQKSTGHCVSFLKPHEWLKTDEACARVILAEPSLSVSIDVNMKGNSPKVY